jgi:hypothetical protein
MTLYFSFKYRQTGKTKAKKEKMMTINWYRMQEEEKKN